MMSWETNDTGEMHCSQIEIPLIFNGVCLQKQGEPSQTVFPLKEVNYSILEEPLNLSVKIF